MVPCKTTTPMHLPFGSRHRVVVLAQEARSLMVDVHREDIFLRSFPRCSLPENAKLSKHTSQSCCFKEGQKTKLVLSTYGEK